MMVIVLTCSFINIYFIFSQVSVALFNNFYFYFFSEVPIVSARANVMLHDDPNNKWVPAGNAQQPGLSKVQIYRHTGNNTFRVVGRKMSNHDVSITFYSPLFISNEPLATIFNIANLNNMDNSWYNPCLALV